MTYKLRRRPEFSPKSPLKGGLAGQALGISAWRSPSRSQISQTNVDIPVQFFEPCGSKAADQVRCVQLAIRAFKKAGGMNGRLAEFRIRDDKPNPPEAVTRKRQSDRKKQAGLSLEATAVSLKRCTTFGDWARNSANAWKTT